MINIDFRESVEVVFEYIKQLIVQNNRPLKGEVQPILLGAAGDNPIKQITKKSELRLEMGMC